MAALAALAAPQTCQPVPVQLLGMREPNHKMIITLTPTLTLTPIITLTLTLTLTTSLTLYVMRGLGAGRGVVLHLD